MPMQNSFEAMDDSELVRLAQQGRRDAFGELTRRNYRMSLKMAMSILRDKESAEDEVQNAWWKAYEHIGQFQVTAKFSTWMTRIVVNQCLMRLRRQKRVQFHYLDDVRAGEDQRGVMELVGSESTPESRLGSSEVADVLRTEIGRIPPLLRKVFTLRDVDELPMPEVAERLGISVAAAKSRLLRARAELRSRMEKHCGQRGVGTLTEALAVGAHGHRLLGLTGGA
jgi:RNA polymerase sigma-70 factor (ECF subfamily)